MRSALLGPISCRIWTVKTIWLTSVVMLTLATQIGGLILWPIIGLATTFPERRWFVGGLGLFVAVYLVVFWLAVPTAARVFGRLPLPCIGDGSLGPPSLLYCAANRHYVVPMLRDELIEVADRMAVMHPGTRVAYLDAGFPFPGLPLLPHLSYGDRRRADLALLFADSPSHARRPFQAMENRARSVLPGMRPSARHALAAQEFANLVKGPVRSRQSWYVSPASPT